MGYQLITGLAGRPSRALIPKKLTAVAGHVMLEHRENRNAAHQGGALAAPGTADGQLGEFCAGLRRLQEASGLSRKALAVRLEGQVSQTQVYTVLAGRIKRPPVWDRTVEPIVLVCTGGDLRRLAEWRRRYDVLVAVHRALNRGRPPGGAFPGAAHSRVVRSLRADTAAFTGRTAELGVLRQAAGPPGARQSAAIHAIDGMPGAGKTALAVHAGHLLADRFPDGQIFVDLHGHSAGYQAAEPGEVLAGLLRAIGVPPADIPALGDERAARWRDATAGRRMLIILDNAASDDQVVPLLPGSAKCLVLVTSRARLGGLRRDYGARCLTLKELPKEQAAELFVRISDCAMDSQRDAVLKLVDICGRLPLAVSIVAAAFDSGDSLSRIQADLINAQDRLAAIDAQLGDDQETGVTAAFELSYRALTAESRRLLSLLGSSPAADFDLYGAAAASGQTVAVTRPQLKELHVHRLVEQTAPGRYRLHDLLAFYARSLVSREEAMLAADRLLDYCQSAAESAAGLLSLYTRPSWLVEDDRRRAELPDLKARQQALSWMSAERANMLAAVDHARDQENTPRMVGLIAALAPYLRLTGPWALAQALHDEARTAARQLGSPLAEASALHDLGIVHYLAERSDDAESVLQQALDIYRACGSRLGEANVLVQLGSVYRVTGDLQEADTVLRQSLEIYQGIDDRFGQGNAHHQLGAVLYLADEYHGAALELQDAVGIYRSLRQQPGEANALTYLGAVLSETDQYQQATEALVAARDIYRELDEKLGFANAMNQLGVALQMTGKHDAAADMLTQSLHIYRQLGNRISEANVLNRLGAVWKDAKRFPEAIPVLEHSLAIFRELGNLLGQADVLSDLGDAHAAAGDPQLGRAELEESRSIFSETEHRLGEMQVLNRLGELLLRLDDPGGALSSYEQARRLAQDLQNLPEMARAAEGMVRCTKALGQGDRAWEC
jgi:tetratricopeptide (TPR) repeat protein